MSVITVSRETGSGGRHIAQQVSQTLGYDLVDKNTIGKVFGKYAAGEFGIDVGYVPDFWTYFEVPADERRERMVDMLNHIILALARQDKMVIVGRSSFVPLAEFADVLNVRIQAPLPMRIQRVMDRRNITKLDQASALVQESDRVRAAFIEGFFGSRWDNSKSFDLVIDTGKVSEEFAISCVVQAAKELQQQSFPGTPSVKTIQVSPGLASIVSEELNNRVGQKLPTRG